MMHGAELLNIAAPVAAKIDWAQTATVVISGIVIVMLVLVVLIFIFKGFGAIMSKTGKSSKAKNKSAKAPGAPFTVRAIRVKKPAGRNPWAAAAAAENARPF